jgi:hypothetical protein
MDAQTLTMLIPIIAILMGGLIILVPIAGLTIRFALKPLIETLNLRRETSPQLTESLARLHERLAVVEQESAELRSTLQELRAAHEFDRRLGSAE